MKEEKFNVDIKFDNSDIRVYNTLREWCDRVEEEKRPMSVTHNIDGINCEFHNLEHEGGDIIDGKLSYTFKYDSWNVIYDFQYLRTTFKEEELDSLKGFIDDYIEEKTNLKPMAVSMLKELQKNFVKRIKEEDSIFTESFPDLIKYIADKHDSQK